VNVIVLAVRNADVLYIVAWTVAIQSWLALMLAAYIRKSRGLMKAAIWAGFGVVFLPNSSSAQLIALGE
jgi:hypothetical protein